MTATEQYIEKLGSLQEGDLGLLRAHAGQRLDHTVEGFDLFAGLWWPLRQRSAQAPRRSVAWLVATLYACCPLPQEADKTLARQLRLCEPHEEKTRDRFRGQFDRLLSLPLADLEPALRWALGQVNQLPATERRLDWVKLTNDLSRWERQSVRLTWAEQYLGE